MEAKLSQPATSLPRRLTPLLSLRPRGETECDAGGETYTLRVANIVPEIEIPSQSMDWFGEELEDRSNGQIDVEVFHAGQLLESQEMLEGLNDGRAQAGYLVADFFGELPIYGGGSLPFVTMDPGAHVAAWNEAAESSEAFSNELEEAGVRLLSHLPVISGSVALAEGPVETLDQLDGKRIRTFGPWARAVELAGATPVFLSTTEAYEGLQRGVVDGMGNFDMGSMVLRGMYEVVPHVLNPRMGMYVTTGLVASEDFYDSLPACLQEILLETGRDAAQHNLEGWITTTPALCEELLSSGGTVNVLGDEAVADLEADIREPLLEEWRVRVLEAGVPEEDLTEFEDIYFSAIEANESADYTDPTVACAAKSDA